MKVAQSHPARLLSPWSSPGQNTGVGSCSFLQGIFPTHWIKPKSPTLQADSLPAEPPGKLKNTGVGSLSLLQRIFPTQESNWGLLPWRRILYQLSYQGIIKEGELLNIQQVHENSDRHFQRTRAWGIISPLPWTKLWYFCQVEKWL